jgi:TIR domain
MPEKEPREIQHHWEASNELDHLSKRADIMARMLQVLAESIASADLDRLDGLHDKQVCKEVLERVENLAFFVLEQQAEAIAREDPGCSDDIMQPEHLTQAAKNLFGSPSIFLSYATNDEDFARELKADLDKEHVGCFLAPLSIQPGSAWPDEIWQAIRACRVFVLLVTADAMKSKWCLLEIGAALGQKKTIVAVLRHTARLPDVLKGVQAKKVQTTEQKRELVQLLQSMCAA